MKKLIVAAILAASAMTSFAQIQYCTPQAMQKAQNEYNTYLQNNAYRRSVNMMFAGSAGGDVLANAQQQWQANDQQAYQQTIGLAKMLCEAEIMQMKMQQQYGK